MQVSVGCKCPPQLGYYPPSFSTTTLPASVPLPFPLQYYDPSSFSTTIRPGSVLRPFQLQYYYPRSSLEFHTGLELISWLIMKLVARKDCYILSCRRRRGVDHALSLSISFTEPGLFYILLSVLDWFGAAWCYRTTLSRCHPPRLLRLSRRGVSRG